MVDHALSTADDPSRQLQEAERECALLRAELAAAQTALAAERRRTEAWLALCPDGCLWTDVEGVIREANLAAGVLLGLALGEPLLAALAAPALAKELARLVRGETAELRFEQVPVAGTDAKRVSLRAAAAYGVDGRVEGVWWLVHDVGEICERDLRTRSANAKRFAASASQQALRSARLLAQSLRDRETVEALARLLEQERKLLTTIMTHTEAQLAYLDREFRFVCVNEAYALGAGYASQELIGRGHFDLFPNAQNQALFEGVRDSGRALSVRARPFVYPSRPELGTTYWDWTLTPIPDREGTVQGLVLSLVDVTERVRHEQAHQAHLARLEVLLQVSREVLSETAVAGVMRRAVDAARELTGARLSAVGHYDQEGTFRVVAVSGVDDVSAYSPGEQAQIMHGGACPLLLKDRDAVRLTDEALRAHPSWQWLPPGHVPLRGLLGARLEGFGGAEDLLMVSDKEGGEFDATDEVLLAQLAALAALALRHIEAREEAERRAAELETVFEAMVDGVMVYDQMGMPVRTNRAAAGLFGLDPLGREREALRQQFRLRHEDGRPAALAELASGRALHGETVRGARYRFVDGAGGERMISASGAPLPGGGAVVVWHDVTALEEARARLAAIITHAPAGIVVADARGEIVLTNPAADRLYSRPVPYRRPYESHAELQLIHPDGVLYDPRDLPLTRAALDGETMEAIEMAIVWPDGQRRELLANAAPIRDSGEGILGAVGMFQDVTERRRTEEQARRYAERLQILHETDQAIRAAPTAEEMAEAVVDRVWRLGVAQQVTVTLFDLAAGEMSVLATRATAGGPAVGWSGPIDRPAEALASLAAGEVFVMPGGQPGEIPCVPGVRTCLMAPLLVRGELLGSLNVGLPDPVPVPEAQVEILRELANGLAIGIHQARLYAEIQRYARELERLVRRRTHSLAASEARFRAVFEEAALGIATLDREGRIVDSNPALQVMLGRSGEELAGRRLAQFAEGGEQGDGDPAFDALMTGRQRFYQAEQRYLCTDGRVLEANVIVSLLGAGQGRARSALVMVEDVTARKQALAAMVHSERLALAGQLAASLAHEINNPLQSVIGCLGLAIEVIAEGGDAGEFMQVAMDELLRASRVVHRLRELGRPVDLERKQVEINELIQRVLLLTARRCQERCVAVDWTPGQGLPLLSAAPDRIQQVFLNVVINALDAMSQGGRLAIDVRPTEAPHGMAIRFADTGMGIPDEVLSTLFEPFYSTKPDGTGLGLYVSHQIVQEHGGRIEVESELGQGATFTVWLPAE